MIDLRDKIRNSVIRLLGRLYRIIESQEEVATRGLVDSLQKQEVLENLLEQSKPARLPGSEDLHYLLATPFRYPPLPWGSRFGGVAESGIFYGSKTIDTVLAETAYYRLLFISDMAHPPPNPVTSFHQVFSAKYCADPGVRLQSTEWQDYWPQLTHAAEYRFCQLLGTQAREVGIQGFETPSARALSAGVAELPTAGAEGVNIALFDPQALLRRPPTMEAEVTAESSSEGVAFLVKTGSGVQSRNFSRDLFEASGQIPQPA